MEARLGWSLFGLRIGVAIVMWMWTLDKMVNPSHAGAVFENFYMIANVSSTALFAIALIQLVIVLAFTIGILKTWSYGLVLIMHAISTLSSYRQYLDPWDHLLFFAAWPMLAAIIALFLLRDYDRYGTLATKGANTP